MYWPEKQLMLQKVRAEGIIPEEQPSKAQELLDIIANIAIPLMEKKPDARMLKLVYAYKQSRQNSKYRESDGICNNHKDMTTSIGISVEILNGDPEYAAFVFMHELMHMQYYEHSTIQFHQALDRIIQRFNQVTKSNIKNDYYGLEARKWQ